MAFEPMEVINYTIIQDITMKSIDSLIKDLKDEEDMEKIKSIKITTDNKTTGDVNKEDFFSQKDTEGDMD